MTTRADPSASDGQGQDGMQELLGLFGKVLASADSAEDVQFSMAPLDEYGRPIESQRVGSTPERLKRVFDIDISVCPFCGGTLRVIADVTDQDVIQTILTHLKQRAPPAAR